MIIGNDQLDALQASGEELFQETAPVDFGLRGGDLAAEHPALAGSFDADGDQDCAIDDAAFQTHFLVAGIEKEVGHLTQGSFPPGFEPLVEPGRGAAHLGGRQRNLGPKQTLQDVDDAAGGDALHIHLGQGEIDRLVGAGALLQGGGIKVAGTHLRHLESHFAQPGEHGLGLETVGVIAPGCGAFIGTRAEKLGSLDLGRLVDQDAQGLARAVQTVLKQGCIGCLQRVRFDTHCHERYTPFSKSWRHAHHRAVCGGDACGATRLRPLPHRPGKTEFTERKIHN